MTRFVIAIMGLLIAALAMAQEPAPPTYDLQAVVRRTLEANPDIRAAEQAVETARTKVEQAKAEGRPSVTAQAGYTQLQSDPSFTVPGLGTIVFGKTDNPFANVGAQWPLYTGGMIENMIKASRFGVDAAGQSFQRRRQERAAEAAVAYYQALSAGQMVGVMEAQVEALREAVRVATALQDQGIVAKVDVLRPTAELESARAQLVQAENGQRLALTNLKRIMNLPMEEEIALQPAEPGLTVPDSIRTAIDGALASRPEMAELQAYRDALKAQAAAARGERRPHVGLQAQYDFERMSTYPEMGNWSVGIGISQSLFDGGRSKAKEAELASQASELEAKEEALKQGIAMQVTNGLLTVRSADERLKATAAALATAEEAHRMAQVSYRNQVLTITDVLVAQTALTAARAQHALAQFDRQAAEIGLHLALGDFPAGTVPSSGTRRGLSRPMSHNNSSHALESVSKELGTVPIPV
jgi:outer membrane protein TolC